MFSKARCLSKTGQWNASLETYDAIIAKPKTGELIEMIIITLFLCLIDATYAIPYCLVTGKKIDANLEKARVLLFTLVTH
jgi:hypothetical protein